MIEMKIMRNQVIRKLTGFNFLLFMMGSLLVTRKAAMAYGPGGFFKQHSINEISAIPEGHGP